MLRVESSADLNFFAAEKLHFVLRGKAFKLITENILTEFSKFKRVRTGLKAVMT